MTEPTGRTLVDALDGIKIMLGRLGVDGPGESMGGVELLCNAISSPDGLSLAESIVESGVNISTSLDRVADALADIAKAVTESSAKFADLAAQDHPTEQEMESDESRDGNEEASLRRQLVDAFIDDRLEITGDPKDVTSIHKLYTEYVLWYVENQPARTETWHNETRQRPVDPLSGVEFGRRLTTRGVGTTVLPFVIGAEKVHARTGVRFK